MCLSLFLFVTGFEPGFLIMLNKYYAIEYIPVSALEPVILLL